MKLKRLHFCYDPSVSSFCNISIIPHYRFDYVFQFLCPPTAHSCFAQTIASESAERTRKFPFAFSDTAGFFFFFFLLIALPFTLGWGNMKVHCTTAQSAKLYAFFFLTKTLSRNTNEFEILTSMLTSVSSVVLHNSGICPDVEWLTFFFLLVGRTRLSCMWACILLPANSSGSTHARRINKTIKETKLYLDKKFQSKKFDFYKLAV